MKLIIAGGREFNNYALLKSKVDHYLSNTDLSTVVIVDGCARGADRLGRIYSKEVLGKDTEQYPFDKYGNGPDRNTVMARNATHLIAFWDGKSSGTRDMIYKAYARKLIVRVVRYEGD